VGAENKESVLGGRADVKVPLKSEQEILPKGTKARVACRSRQKSGGVPWDIAHCGDRGENSFRESQDSREGKPLREIRERSRERTENYIEKNESTKKRGVVEKRVRSICVAANSVA